MHVIVSCDQSVETLRAAPALSKQSKEVTIGLASARPHYVWTSMASQAGVFRGARLSSLPTNAVCGEG